MSINVVCGQCHSSFRVADKNAGQRGRCFTCGAIVRVPDRPVAAAPSAPKIALPPSASPASPATPPRHPAARHSASQQAAPHGPAPQRSAPPPPAPEPAPAPVDDPFEQAESYDLVDEPVTPAPMPVATMTAPARPAAAATAARAAQVAQYAVPGTHAYPRPGFGARTPAREMSAFSRENWPFWAQVGAGALPILLAIVARLGIDALAMPAFLIAVLLMGGMFMWGKVGIWVVAYNENPVCLLLYLFMPFYAIYFILSRMEDVLPHVLRMVAAFLVVLITMVLVKPIMPMN